MKTTHRCVGLTFKQGFPNFVVRPLFIALAMLALDGTIFVFVRNDWPLNIAFGFASGIFVCAILYCCFLIATAGRIMITLYDGCFVFRRIRVPWVSVRTIATVQMRSGYHVSVTLKDDAAFSIETKSKVLQGLMRRSVLYSLRKFGCLLIPKAQESTVDQLQQIMLRQKERSTETSPN